MPMNEQSHTELIELYLQGSLTEEELEQFNKRLMVDERFRQEVSLQRALVKNISRKGRSELRLHLKTYHRRMTQTNANDKPEAIINEVQPLALRRINKTVVSLMVAASVVIVLAVVGIQFYFNLSANGIYTQQFVPYSVSIKRGSPIFADEIVSLYRSGNYKAYISKYQAKPERSLQEIFLAGNAYLVNGETNQAINAFRKVLEQDEKLHVEHQQYGEDSEYFLALAYVKNNELQKAELLLKKIVFKPTHGYHHEVSDWLMFKIKMLRRFRG